MGCDSFLSCIAEPARYRILEHLIAGPATVTDLVAATGQTQSNASHHLRLLRECGFVTSRRDGRHCHYSLADASITHLLQAVETARSRLTPCEVPC